MTISTDPDLRLTVSEALKQYPDLVIVQGSRHSRVRSKSSGDFIPVPRSPSDIRAKAHLRSQLRRLGETGRGLIAAKKREF